VCEYGESRVFSTLFKATPKSKAIAGQRILAIWPKKVEAKIGAEPVAKTNLMPCSRRMVGS
jgi:hypothetical protein